MIVMTRWIPAFLLGPAAPDARRGSAARHAAYRPLDSIPSSGEGSERTGDARTSAWPHV